jgi:hypothetical protein
MLSTEGKKQLPTVTYIPRWKHTLLIKHDKREIKFSDNTPPMYIYTATSKLFKHILFAQNVSTFNWLFVDSLRKSLWKIGLKRSPIYFMFNSMHTYASLTVKKVANKCEILFVIPIHITQEVKIKFTYVHMDEFYVKSWPWIFLCTGFGMALKHFMWYI